MSYNEIIQKVSSDTGIPAMIVDKAYRAYWRAIREYISSLPLKGDLTDEEFSMLRPNINIPSIGKLYVTLDRYKAIKKTFHQKQELNKNQNAAHQED
jgi:hypothetical protein